MTEWNATDEWMRAVEATAAQVRAAVAALMPGVQIVYDGRPAPLQLAGDLGVLRAIVDGYWEQLGGEFAQHAEDCRAAAAARLAQAAHDAHEPP